LDGFGALLLGCNASAPPLVATHPFAVDFDRGWVPTTTVPWTTHFASRNHPFIGRTFRDFLEEQSLSGCRQSHGASFEPRGRRPRSTASGNHNSVATIIRIYSLLQWKCTKPRLVKLLHLVGPSGYCLQWIRLSKLPKTRRRHSNRLTGDRTCITREIWSEL